MVIGMGGVRFGLYHMSAYEIGRPQSGSRRICYNEYEYRHEVH